MDGLSAAASVAGIAAIGLQLSKNLYEVIKTISSGKEEIRACADDIALLADVLDQLQEILNRDKLYFRLSLEEKTLTIVARCESLFKDIEKYTRNAKGIVPSNIVWYFKRERVKPLRASLESLKTTLIVLLGVVQVAKTSEETMKDSVKAAYNASVGRERRRLVYHVIDNRRDIDKLKILEEEVLNEKLELDADGLPFIYNGNVPLPDVFHRKPRSERSMEFVSAGSSAEEDGKRSRPLERPSRTRPTRHYSHRRSFNPGNINSGHDGEDHDTTRPNRGARSASPRGRNHERKNSSSPRARDTANRSLPDPLTSALILSVIPHEKADRDFPQDQIKEKAESTVRTMLEDWTNVLPSTGQKPSEGTSHETEKPTQVDSNAGSDWGWGGFGFKGSSKEANRQKVNSIKTEAPSSVSSKSSEEQWETVSNNKGFNRDDASSVFQTLGDALDGPNTGPMKIHMSGGNEASQNRNEQTHRNRRYPARPRAAQREYRPHAPYVPEAPEAPEAPAEQVDSWDYIPSAPAPPPHYLQTPEVNPYGYNYPIPGQYIYPPHVAYAPQQWPSAGTAPIPPPAATPAPPPPAPPAPTVNILPVDKTQLSPVTTINDPSSDKTVDAIEKILGFLQGPTMAMGALEAKHRQLEEDCRVKASIDTFKQKLVAAEEAEQNSKPLTLHDCLDRRFVFPLELCRSWWVSCLSITQHLKSKS